MTLVVRRATPGGALRGAIRAHYWRGDAAKPTPPACAPGGREATVLMTDATGRVDGQSIAFGATTYTVAAVACGPAPRYAPDHYSGVVDPALLEFQSVNNAGPMVNEPTLFRRVSCSTSLAQIGVGAAPPEYTPKRRGCGR
jgi:hypothetical protein